MVKPSAGDLHTITTEFGDCEYDADMPIGALRKLFGAAGTGDLGGLIDGLSAFVTKWPFKGKPTDPEAWNDLRRSEFGAITQAVMKDLGESGEA